MRAKQAVSMTAAGCLLLLLSACVTAVPEPAAIDTRPAQVTAVQADHLPIGADGIVLGRVTTVRGDPSVGITITARGRSATPACLRCGETVTRTAQDGTFTFDLPAGDYFFTCTSSTGGVCRPADGTPMDIVAVRAPETDIALELMPRRHAHPR